MLPRRWPVLACLVVLACLFTAIALADFRRGPWYDEFYTLYVTQGGTAIWRQFTASWLPDNHPPTYYALARATAWLGETAETRRLLNIALGAGVLACGAMAVREVPRHALLAVVFVLALVAHPAAVLTGSELRSYFLSFCGAGLLTLALTLAWLEGGAPQRWTRAALLAGFLIAFNTHVVTTIIAGALAVPFLATALIRRDRALFLALLCPTLIAAAIFAGVTAIQLGYWEQNTRAFWIEPGWDAAKWTLYYFTARTIEAMPLVLLSTGPGLVLMASSIRKSRRIDRDGEVLVLIGLGCLLAVSVLVGLHMARPLLIERYLVALVAPLAMMAALPVVRLLAALPLPAAGGLLALLLLASCTAIAGNFTAAVNLPSWNGTARAIAAEVRACPDTAVHTLPAFNAAVMAMPPADNRRTIPFAYGLMARVHGFRLEPAGSRRISRTCPTLFWAEHDPRHAFGVHAVLDRVRSEGFALNRITQRRTGNGWIAISRPTRSK